MNKYPEVGILCYLDNRLIVGQDVGQYKEQMIGGYAEFLMLALGLGILIGAALIYFTEPKEKPAGAG